MCNKSTTEFEIEVSGGGRIIQAMVMPDGKCKLVVQVAAPESAGAASTVSDDVFVKVEVSKLSLSDDFMEYQPKTEAERNFKNLVEIAIKSGLKDFWRPKFDPAFNEAGTGICYKSGNKPAVGKSYNWWEKVAKEFNTECKSRLGTRLEYIAFLAVIIKKMVSSGWEESVAWHAICNDSMRLGHYWDSENAKHQFENTGCREICGFYDLANTYKILAEDEEGGSFWLAGGYYLCEGYDGPLAVMYHGLGCYDFNRNSVGWLVLEAGSTDH